jgi:hypothetical protein
MTHTSNQLQLFFSIIKKKKLNLEHLQAVLKSGLLSDIFDPSAYLKNRLEIRMALGLGPRHSRIGTYLVDYRQSLEKMIMAGNYSWKHSDITSRQFWVQGKGRAKFEATLVRFERQITSEEAIRHFDGIDRKRPWKPAKIEHLLALGAAKSNVQRMNPIVGLGSAEQVGGFRGVPYLDKTDSKLNLALGWYSWKWNDVVRFLAVRNTE